MMSSSSASGCCECCRGGGRSGAASIVKIGRPPVACYPNPTHHKHTVSKHRHHLGCPFLHWLACFHLPRHVPRARAHTSPAGRRGRAHRRRSPSTDPCDPWASARAVPPGETNRAGTPPDCSCPPPAAPRAGPGRTCDCLHVRRVSAHGDDGSASHSQGVRQRNARKTSRTPTETNERRHTEAYPGHR